MDQVALQVLATGGWTYLGGDDDAKKPLVVVVRTFDGPVAFTLGPDPTGPGAEDPVTVPAGEGRRLSGRHFFVRPLAPLARSQITYRGL